MPNPLAKLPPAVRLYTYVVLGILFLAFSAWQVAEGDWLKAIGLFFGSLGFGTASSNVPTAPVDQKHDLKRRRGVPR